jgi:hypothetical protein
MMNFSAPFSGSSFSASSLSPRTALSNLFSFRQRYRDNQTVDTPIEVVWADSTVLANGRTWAVASFDNRADVNWNLIPSGSRIYMRLQGDGAVLGLLSPDKFGPLDVSRFRWFLGLPRNERAIVRTANLLEEAGGTLHPDCRSLVASPLSGDFVIGDHLATSGKQGWAFTACRSAADVARVVALGGIVTLSGVVDDRDFSGGATGVVPEGVPVKKAAFRVIPGLRALTFGARPICSFVDSQSVLAVSLAFNGSGR